MWAEDGNLFWIQQYTDGLVSLFKPYAGYHNFVPRLTAAVVVNFDPRLAPLLFTYASAIWVAWSAATVASCSLPPVLALLMGATLTLPPHPSGEIFANTANVQWLLAPTLAVIVSTSLPQGRVARYNQVVFAIFSGLSGPFSVFLAPFTLYRFLFRGRDAAVIAALAVACVQVLTLIFASPPVPDIGLPMPEHLFRAMVSRVFWPHWIGISSGVIVVCAAVIIKRNRLPRIALLVLAVAVLLGALVKFSHFESAFDVPANGPRYFYIPQLVLFWCSLSLCFSGATATFAGVTWLTIAVLFYPHSSFKKAPLIDEHWDRFASEIGKTTLVIPINPSGWTITVPPR